MTDIGSLKNNSVNRNNGLNGGKNVYLAQVIGIEGDASWDIAKALVLEGAENQAMEEKRLIDKGTGRIIFRLNEKASRTIH